MAASAWSYIPLIGSVYPVGYSNQTPLVSSQDGITPLNLLSNPFPNGLLPPIGNSQGLLTLVGQNVSYRRAVGPHADFPQLAVQHSAGVHLSNHG